MKFLSSFELNVSLYCSLNNMYSSFFFKLIFFIFFSLYNNIYLIKKGKKRNIFKKNKMFIKTLIKLDN